jgi:tetratricopeptide (TPR) repeat protein
MIPGMWFNFARGQGSVREMEAVLYHNLEDIVSMAPLAHIIAATLAGMMEPHPQDWLALGRAWQRSGDVAGAERAYRRALEGPQPPAHRAQAMRELALLLKRHERREEAAIWWEALAAMNRPNDVEALVELAKYHEWHTGDIEKARAWTLEAITRAENWSSPYRRREMLAELRHRLQRLERKLRQERR